MQALSDCVSLTVRAFTAVQIAPEPSEIVTGTDSQFEVTGAGQSVSPTGETSNASDLKFKLSSLGVVQLSAFA